MKGEGQRQLGEFWILAWWKSKAWAGKVGQNRLRMVCDDLLRMHLTLCYRWAKGAAGGGGE